MNVGVLLLDLERNQDGINDDLVEFRDMQQDKSVALINSRNA